jgi:hypothetical protein
VIKLQSTGTSVSWEELEHGIRLRTCNSGCEIAIALYSLVVTSRKCPINLVFDDLAVNTTNTSSVNQSDVRLAIHTTANKRT